MIKKRASQSSSCLKRINALLEKSTLTEKDALELGRKINASITKRHAEKDQSGILKLAGACADEAKDLERWKKEIYRNRKKQKLRTFKLRVDKITSAFEKEAKRKGITKKDLLDELVSVQGLTDNEVFDKVTGKLVAQVESGKMKSRKFKTSELY